MWVCDGDLCVQLLCGSIARMCGAVWGSVVLTGRVDLWWDLCGPVVCTRGVA